MPAYNFSSRTSSKMPTLAKTAQFQQLSQLGLDMVSPLDLMKNGRTPYAKNFRLYAQQSDDRQVSVSNRKGSDYYTTALSQTKVVSQESTTGASTIAVNKTTNILLEKFTAVDSNRVTRIDVKIGNPNGATGPVLMQLWSDKDGVPDVKLAESSLITIPIVADYVIGYFMKAPKLTSGEDYWIVLGEQDDCTGEYLVSTTTSSTLAKITNSSLAVATAQTFSINYKVYTAPDVAFKGGHRFAKDNGNNITVAASGTTMYKVDESTRALIPIASGLSSSATYYSFDNADNKLFWVNSYDQLTTWDGVLPGAGTNLVTNGTFETNTTGWNAGAGTTLTRVTTAGNFHSGVAACYVTAASGTRDMYQTISLSAYKGVYISAWVKGTAGQPIMIVTTGNSTSDSVLFTGDWQQITTVVPISSSAITSIKFDSTVNFYIDDITYSYSGVEQIIDADLPIFSQICYHKSRVWGVSASDPNKIHFSMVPGNPVYQADNVTPEIPTKQWYYAWRSIDFWYIPLPHSGSPITKIISFQDSLFIFTQDGKYTISGFDAGSFVPRESTGFQGALSPRGVTKDENNIYFVGYDGFYMFDGTYDTKISTPIDPLFNSASDKTLICPAVWKNKIRFYMPSLGSLVNDSCALWNKDILEWEYDTDTYVSMAIPYEDANDDNQLVELSSLTAVMYLAEQGYTNLGTPIDFEYRFNYNALGSPAQKKRIKKFFPILQGVDSTFPVTIAIDRDFQNSPKYKYVTLTVNGAVFGTDHELGDGVLFGGQTSFKMNKLRLSGYGYYWQMRILRKAVNNRIAFVGAQFSYKTKRI